MILVVFLDWHYREKRFHTNPDIFKSAFIYMLHMNRPSVWYPSTRETSESSHRNIRLI